MLSVWWHCRFVAATYEDNKNYYCGIVLLLGGCESLHFYKQAALGQLSLLQKAADVVVKDPDTPEALRERLETVQSILQFAEQQLDLPVGDRYQRYVGLERDYVVWNVFMYRLAMNSVQWCYPLVGCAPYRGYFAQADATALAANYADKGFDTYVAGVSANQLWVGLTILCLAVSSITANLRWRVCCFMSWPTAKSG